MPVRNFKVANGGGVDYTGDAHIISGGGINLFNPIQGSGWCGKSGKNANEVNAFFAFDVLNTDPVNGVPLGSVINGLNFEFSSVTSGTGAGSFRMGYILETYGTTPQTIWPINGWARPIDRTVGPSYVNAFQFPNSGNRPPHASQDNSLAIEPGILAFNAWATGNIAYAAIVGANTRVSIGFGIGGESFNEPNLFSIFNALFNNQGDSNFALTMDSQAVGSGDNRILFWMTENGNPSFDPELVVDYTENPPVFTSTPILDGFVTCLYQYDADADPYSLGDQTAGIFVDVVYTLEVAPAGMTIDSGTGLVSWTPTVAGEGVNPVTVRATNEGGVFTDQSFNVTVPIAPTPNIFTTPPTDAVATVPYEYTAFGTNLINDACQSLALTYTLEVAPAGATVGPVGPLGAIVNWTPSVPQAGNQPFTLRATNTMGNFFDQSWVVNTRLVGCPEGTSLAKPAVGGNPDAKAAVSGAPRAAPSVSGELEARPSVSGESVVRSAVSGEARRCKE